MMRLARAAVLVVCSSLTWVSPVAADVVTDWNAFALPRIAAGRPGTGPATMIDLAIMHAAMHDAIQAFDQRFEPYAGPISATAGSFIVAAAKAAHDVLWERLVSQRAAVDAFYASYITGLSPAPPPGDITAGEVIGALAAAHALGTRVGDGSFPTTFDQFVGGTGPGEWRPNTGTPGMVAPWLGAVRPFTIDSVQRCQPDAIPELTSIEYAEAYNEVKALGSAASTERTSEQGELARMFSGNFAGQFSRLLRSLAAAHIGGADLASHGDRARLFALANMATADAIICAWESKKKFNFWRPSHAIRNGDQDGNILTVPDTGWSPYLGNPNYPDYTSGANNFAGSMTRMMALFFGSDRAFEFEIFADTPGVPLLATDPNPRVYTRFSDVAKDVVDARIYLGIHFRFADTEARSQGRRVAGYAFGNFLRPVK